jgi:hypothetical protein
MRNRIATSPISARVSHIDLDAARISLHAIHALPMTPFEHTYFTILSRTLSHAYTDPSATYTTFVSLYNTPSQWSHDEFQAFIDPNNSVAQVLLAHFIAIQAILTPVLYLERVGFQGVDAPTCVLSWIEGVWRNVPLELRRYVQWPREVARWPFTRFLGQMGEDGEELGLE